MEIAKAAYAAENAPHSEEKIWQNVEAVLKTTDFSKYPSLLEAFGNSKEEVQKWAINKIRTIAAQYDLDQWDTQTLEKILREFSEALGEHIHSLNPKISEDSTTLQLMCQRVLEIKNLMDYLQLVVDTTKIETKFLTLFRSLLQTEMDVREKMARVLIAEANIPEQETSTPSLVLSKEGKGGPYRTPINKIPDFEQEKLVHSPKNVNPPNPKDIVFVCPPRLVLLKPSKKPRPKVHQQQEIQQPQKFEKILPLVLPSLIVMAGIAVAIYLAHRSKNPTPDNVRTTTAEAIYSAMPVLSTTAQHTPLIVEKTSPSLSTPRHQ